VRASPGDSHRPPMDSLRSGWYPRPFLWLRALLPNRNDAKTPSNQEPGRAEGLEEDRCFDGGVHWPKTLGVSREVTLVEKFFGTRTR
jgi:hypothetical protein